MKVLEVDYNKSVLVRMSPSEYERVTGGDRYGVKDGDEVSIDPAATLGEVGVVLEMLRHVHVVLSKSVVLESQGT